MTNAVRGPAILIAVIAFALWAVTGTAAAQQKVGVEQPLLILTPAARRRGLRRDN